MIAFLYRGMSIDDLLDGEVALDPARDFWGGNKELFLTYFKEIQQSGLNPTIHDTYDNPLQQLVTWSLRDLQDASIDFTPSYADAQSYARNYCGSQLLHNLKLITEQVDGFNPLRAEISKALAAARLRSHRQIVLKVRTDNNKFALTQWDEVVKLVKPLLHSEIEDIVHL